MRLRFFLPAFAFAAAATSSWAVSGNDMVRVEVRPKSESDRKDIKGTSVDTKSQKLTLEIILSGKPKNPETRVVKWIIFGKDLKTNNIAPLESGEEPLNLATGGQQKFESKVASSTSTPEYVIVKGKGGKDSKRVAAEGSKILGYGVQVKEGDTVLGEAFSSDTLKQQMK